MKKIHEVMSIVVHAHADYTVYSRRCMSLGYGLAYLRRVCTIQVCVECNTSLVVQRQSVCL